MYKMTLNNPAHMTVTLTGWELKQGGPCRHDELEFNIDRFSDLITTAGRVNKIMVRDF